MSTETIESRSPQNQSEVVVSAPAADRDTVAAAFSRAREAQREWRRNALARADALTAAAEALNAAKDEVVDLMVREVGKPLTEAVRRARARRAHPALPGAGRAWTPTATPTPPPRRRTRARC